MVQKMYSKGKNFLIVFGMCVCAGTNGRIVPSLKIIPLYVVVVAVEWKLVNKRQNRHQPKPFCVVPIKHRRWIFVSLSVCLSICFI